MFIDKVTIEVRAGKGGDGMIAFHKEKFIDRGGPSGGNGGRGGSIIFRASKGVTTLLNFRHSKVIKAEDGERGMTKNRYGRCAEDVIVDVPIGTVVYNEDHSFICDLNEDNQTFVVAKGGRGGRGNACFKSPTNRTPRTAENGMKGETKRIIMELKLLADVGLVGFPSVGKSTFLSVVTAAKPEIADYPFTTIVPNLGVTSLKDGRSFVIADLPGLIEGAHKGKGLGLQFLRHIERCRVLLHIIDMSSPRDPYQDYVAINNELEQYGFNIINRPTIIVGSKVDEEGAIEKLEELEKKIGKKVIPLSALTNEGVDEILYKAADLLQTTDPFPLYDVENKVEGVKIYETKDEDKIFDILRKDAHTFVIHGERIERTYSLINLSTDEGMMKLLAYLRKVGVDDRLREMGAQDGDTVLLCDFEFEYYN